VNPVTPQMLSGGHILCRVTSVRLIPSQQPNVARESGDGSGSLACSWVNGVDNSWEVNVFVGLILTLQPNAAREPGDGSGSFAVSLVMNVHHGISRVTAKQP
jgi:hypothetical protein